MLTIRASRVSAPTRSAVMVKLPVPLMVPPVTRSPVVFSTGMGSPLTMDSSMELRPSSTEPSTGIFSPGRTRSMSPALIFASGTSLSWPHFESRRAVFGANPSSAFSAPLVRARAFNSSTCPSRTSTVITAAASK